MSEAMDKMIRNECDVVAANRERSGKEESKGIPRPSPVLASFKPY